MSDQAVKSNAPWILGIVGFVMAIIHSACAVLCAAVGSAASDVAKKAAEDPELAKQLAESGTDVSELASAGNTMMVGAIVSIVVFVLCFVLGFFGKSEKSNITGIIMIVLAIVGTVLSVTPTVSIFGVIAGILFIIGGALSVANHKKGVADAA